MEQGNGSSSLGGVESQFSYGERVAVASAVLLIFVVGTVGNSVVILAVLLSRELQTVTNAFVVSLATADLCYCLLLPLSSAVALLSPEGWPWDSEAVCWMAAVMSFASAGASLYNLACIALGRLLLVRGSAATFHRVFTPRKTALMVLATWAVPLTAILVPPAFGVGGLGYDRTDNTCSDLDAHRRAGDFHLVLVLCLYPVPLATLVASYAALFLHVRRHFRRQRESFRESHRSASGDDGVDGEPGEAARQLGDRFEKQTHRQQMQITLNLFVVSCAFLVCSAPFSLALLAPTRNPRTLLFLSVPFTANSAVNPVLYTVHHPKFAVVIGSLLRCRLADIPKPTKLLLALRARRTRPSHTMTL